MKIACSKKYIVGVVLAAAVIILQQNIIIAVTDRTVSVVGTATKPVIPGALLDDFRYRAPVNVWNAATGTFSKSAATPPPANESCAASYAVDSDVTRGNCLKLNYSVSALNTYTGYYSSLGSVSLANPAAYTAVSFYVKGAAGGEFFKVALKNTSTTQYFDSKNNANYYRNESAVYITDYLDEGVTTGWKKVTIPFHNFANLDGFSSMKEFVIVFENSQSTTNGSATSGTVYIDDIAFETTPMSAVRIDHFGDKVGACALGGDIGAGGGNGGTILPAPKPAPIFEAVSEANSTEYPSLYPLYNNVMRLNYDVNSGYAFAFMIFGGGQDIDPNPDTNRSGWIAIPRDFSAYNYLYLVVRGAAGGNPKVMRIELADGSPDAKIVRIAGITADFQGYRIPFSSFLDSKTGAANLNKAAIKQLNFVFEGGWIGGVGGNKTGIAYIDSVQFEQ